MPGASRGHGTGSPAFSDGGTTPAQAGGAFILPASARPADRLDPGDHTMSPPPHLAGRRAPILSFAAIPPTVNSG
jgi:hypothetical protein